ncbi:MAG: Zn-finger protein [Thorarchaeia virus VerdaV2]|uniref:Zn-finger protein n=1 Tax=Thorarchaeia virus VerdaV2 TaxID=3070171 RepID=A0AA35G7C4_9CAUD|nr:MAG: Zn-finger protein [Thorarchaeia virus VerdaV2]BDI54916.1 MAG: Zn-finger protein [Thorarchaeia virus VerdaV2]
MSGLRMKSFKELIETIGLDTATMYYPNKCYNCKRGIQFFKTAIQHYNVANNPPVKFFCSKSCRDGWILEQKLITTLL